MIKFNDLPIRTKIISIILVGMFSATFVALANFIAFDLQSIKQSMEEELLILSRITAARSNAAVAFKDHRKATQNLEHLSLRKSILSACIYDNKDELFAQFYREPLEENACYHWFSGYEEKSKNSLVVVETIANKSTALGKIVVVSDLSPIKNKIKNWAILSVFTILISTLVVVIMSRRLQKSIVQPLTQLTQVMDSVRDNNDLALRAYPAGKDELGALVEAFNEMLGIIEYSHTDLEIVYKELVYKSTKAEAAAVELEAHVEQVKGMLSGAAHDLRQPLQAMALFVDMLVLQGVDEKQQGLLDKLQQAMENLRTMFNEILDFSRLDYQEGTAELQLLELEELFDKLQLEFDVLARDKGLELRTRETDITLWTIPGVLERVIRNLLSNAVNYTDIGGILLAARNCRDSITIEVWDTGRGIPDKKQQTIFQKYEQADAGKEVGSGYGLGLAIVRQFVEMMGYRMFVKSREGHGSCFKIVIPKALAESNDSTARLDFFQQEENSVKNYHEANFDEVKEAILKTNIILVDDDDITRDAVGALLEAFGYEVLKFTGLDDVVDYFSSADFVDPDLVISDYQLGPGLTGDMVIQEVRDLTGIDVPAFIITGNQSQKIQKEITDKGFEFLLKPVGASQIREKIVEYLE